MNNPQTSKVNGDIVRIDRKDYKYMFTHAYRRQLIEKCKNNPLIDLGNLK